MKLMSKVFRGIRWGRNLKNAASVLVVASVLLGVARVCPVAAWTEEPEEIPAGAVVVDGHAYYLYEDGMTWPEAEASCESVGGHLVCITTEVEQDVVQSLLVNGTKNGYWIGGHLVGDEWEWITGEDSEYSNWAWNQPDDYKDVEDSLMIYNDYNPKSKCEIGEWNDLCYDGSCQEEVFFGMENLGYICEWETVPEGFEGSGSLNPANTPDASESTYHVVNGDNDHKYSFCFGENEELEDMLRSVYSKNYNPRLAHFLAVMASSAGSEELVKENYEELGFSHEAYHYDSTGYAAYSIGTKEVEDGSLVVMITIRGTNGIEEWGTDITLGEKAVVDKNGDHEGFQMCEEEIYSSLCQLFGDDVRNTRVKYVITGHSLGAGVGNLLAKELYESGVSPYCIFDYNFACPNVGAGPKDASHWNDHGELNFIINVGNWCDIITHIPGTFLFSDYDKGRLWKKYGKSFWFNNGFQLWFTGAHDMETYLDYLQKELPSSYFWQREFVGEEFKS